MVVVVVVLQRALTVDGESAGLALCYGIPELRLDLLSLTQGEEVLHYLAIGQQACLGTRFTH